MSKAEKAYFKRYGYKGAKKDDKYLLLFDAIDRQKEHDEQKIRDRFAKSGKIKSFSAAKNHLYQLVLKSLVDFSASKRSEDKLLQLDREIQFLIDRGLDDQAGKRVQAAKKLALENDLSRFMPSLHHSELSLIPYLPQRFDDRQHSIAEERKVLEALLSENKYRELYGKMTNIVGKFGVIVREVSHVQVVKDVLSDPALADDSAPASFMASYLYLSTRKILHQVICEYEASYNDSRRLVELFDAQPAYKDIYSSYYQIAMRNLLDDMVGSERYQEFDVLAAKISTFLRENGNEKMLEEGMADIQVRTLYKELQCGNYDNALLLANEIEDAALKRKYHPMQEIMWRYLLALTYFYHRDFRLAMNYMAELLNHPNLQYFRDYHGFTLVLNLLIQVERNKPDHIEYARNKLYRFLNKNEAMYAVEKLLLTFLRKSFRFPPNSSEQRNALIDLRAEMIPLLKDPFEKHAFSYLDFISWIDSRIAGIPFLDSQKRA